MEHDIETIDSSESDVDTPFLPIKNASSPITDEDDDYYEDSEQLYCSTGTIVTGSIQQVRQRKQQMQHLNRDDHNTQLLTVEEYSELEHQQTENKKTIKNNRLYMLNPDDFPEDPIKQQQIRRAKVTHDHHKRKSKDIQRLRSENLKLQDMIRLYEKRETFMKQSCTCDAVSKVLSGQMDLSVPAANRISHNELNFQTSNIPPNLNNPALIITSKPSLKSDQSSFVHIKKFSRGHNDFKFILPKGLNPVLSSSAIFPNSPQSNSRRYNDVTIKPNSNYFSKQKLEAQSQSFISNPKTPRRILPQLRPINSMYPPINPSGQASVSSSTISLLEMLERDTTKKHKSPPKSVPIISTLHKDKEIKMRKETDPQILFQNTLKLINDIVEQGQIMKHKEDATNLAHNKRPLVPQTLMIEASEEILRYYSDEVIPLPRLRKTQMPAVLQSDNKIDLKPEDLHLLDTSKRRSKRSAAASRLTTAELLRGTKSQRVSKPVTTPSPPIPPPPPPPLVPIVSPSDDAKNLSDVDWDCIELQYLRPRQYSLRKTNKL